MHVANLIAHYGYAGVLAGSVIEGDAVVALGGIAARSGYLHLPLVIAIAAAGALIGDVLTFIAGRVFGTYLLDRWPQLTAQNERMAALVKRHDVLLLLGRRFVFGLRVPSAIAIGMSGMTWLRFGSWSAIGACLWAAVIACAGYLLGTALPTAVGTAAHMLSLGGA